MYITKGRIKIQILQNKDNEATRATFDHEYYLNK